MVLRVGEIRKYPLCGLRDDILNFRHGVPRSAGTYPREIVPGLECGFSCIP